MPVTRVQAPMPRHVTNHPAGLASNNSSHLLAQQTSTESPMGANHIRAAHAIATATPVSVAQDAHLPEIAATPISGAEAGRRAQQLNGGGRILSVDPQSEGYRVKLLKDGEVQVINVPPT